MVNWKFIVLKSQTTHSQTVICNWEEGVFQYKSHQIKGLAKFYKAKRIYAKVFSGRTVFGKSGRIIFCNLWIFSIRTENWKWQTIFTNRQKDWNFAKSGFLIFFVGKGQAIFVRKGGGFEKSKAARTGLVTCNRIKSPKKGDYKKAAFNEKNQNQTEKRCTQRNLWFEFSTPKRKLHITRYKHNAGS